MAKVYKWCSGNTTQSGTITLTSGSTQTRTYTSGSWNVYEEYVILTFTSTVTVDEDLDIYYSYQTRYGENGWWDSWRSGEDHVTMLSGTSSVTKEVLLTQSKTYDDPNYDETEDNEWKDYDLESQPTIPVCYVPPTCTLGITGVTVTDVTLMGGSDGKIKIELSGVTGTTIEWYLNGSLIATNSYSTYTFTSLSAGYYQVTVKDGDCTAQENNINVLDGEFRTGDFTISQPSDLVAAENPIVYNIKTQVVGNGKKAKMKLEIAGSYGGTVSDGDYYEFNLTSPYEYTQRFYAKGFPNKSNYFLASTLTDADGNTVGSNTRYEIAQSLADALQQDVLIPKVYTISYDGVDTIYLEAKEYGERFTLSTNNVKKSGLNLWRTMIQAGENKYDGQQVDGYSIGVEIYENDNLLQYTDTGLTTNYQRISELLLPFSQDNNHRFDISPIIKNYVYSNRPSYDFTGYTILPNMMKPFFLRVFEKYPLVKNTNTKKKRYKTSLPVKWVINSALDRYEKNNMSAYTQTYRYFLTNSPNPKLIQRESQEYLYFIVEKDLGATLDVRGDLEFWDGTSESDITYFTISTGTTNAGGVMMLNISYDKLGLSSYESGSTTTRKIKNATFAVYSGGTQYTQERTYHFEIEDKPRKFGIVFQNELGGYDSFDFVGIVENTIDRQIGTFTLPIDFNNDGSMPQGAKQTATYNTKVTKKIIVNSGWLDETHFNWLRELMESNDIYSYTTDNQNYLNLNGFKYQKSSLDNLYDVECTFTLTTFENNISV